MMVVARISYKGIKPSVEYGEYKADYRRRLQRAKSNIERVTESQ